MATDKGKHGSPWSDDELDAIVATYFVMLLLELQGQSYIKAHHNEPLMQELGRTHRSVEFKNQNISAVLEELGLPWIPGYKPKRNYQQAIFGAIERYLSAQQDIFQYLPKGVPTTTVENIFVPAPQSTHKANPLPPGLERLVRKFDPVDRDHRNRSLGKAGEEFVLNIERQVLTAGGRPDLACQVRWVAVEDGDGAGFDIRSFDFAGAEKFIEVKTTNGGIRTPFFLTRNEQEVAEANADVWRLYRVYQFSQTPRIFSLAPPLSNVLHLRVETWRASF